MGKKPIHPPQLFLKFFRWYCDPAMIDFIEGDPKVYQLPLAHATREAAEQVLKS